MSAVYRTGSIFAAGDLSLVNLKASGTGTIVLSGAARVTGQLDGTTNLYVDTPDGEQVEVLLPSSSSLGHRMDLLVK